MPPPKSTDLGSSTWRRLEERRYRTDEGVDIRWRTPSPNLVCERSVTLVSGVSGFRARSKIGPHLAVCTCRPRSFRRATTCPGKVLMLAFEDLFVIEYCSRRSCSKESLPRIFPLVRGGAAKRRASMVLKIYGSWEPLGRVRLLQRCWLLKGPARGGPQGLTRNTNRAQAALFDTRTKCEPLCQFCVS
jgi:hypothetical protein